MLSQTLVGTTTGILEYLPPLSLEPMYLLLQSTAVQGGGLSLELMANSLIFDGVICNAQGADWHRTASSTAVKQINQGDAIFIRTHHNYTSSSDVISYNNAETCFAGWFLF